MDVSKSRDCGDSLIWFAGLNPNCSNSRTGKESNTLRKLCIAICLFVALVQFALAGRYDDARIGRFLQIDPKAHEFPGWSPYNYALENPLKFIDPNGEEVRAYTERLGLGVYSKSVPGPLRSVPPSFRLQALFFGAVVWEAYGPRHSFIQVTTDKADKMIELGGPLPGHKEGNPLANQAAGAKERPDQLEHSVSRPVGVAETDYSFENKILEIHNQMSEYIKTNQLPVYEGLGTNSNSYVEFLIQAAGGKVDLPSNAKGHSETQKYFDIYGQLLKQREEEAKKKESEQH